MKATAKGSYRLVKDTFLFQLTPKIAANKRVPFVAYGAYSKSCKLDERRALFSVERSSESLQSFMAFFFAFRRGIKSIINLNKLAYN